MAENKKSFILYCDLINNIDHLTNEEKGILFNHLLEYVNDKNPVLTDRLILTAWKPIERQLKRDLKKFDEVKSKRSEAGKRSAELRALKKRQQSSTNPTSVKSVQHSSTNSTVNDNDNDNVNDNDNEIKDKSFTINNKSFLDRVKKDQQYLETLAMQNKISVILVLNKLNDFETNLITTKKQHQNYKEFAIHFSYWLNKNKPQPNKRKISL